MLRIYVIAGVGGEDPEICKLKKIYEEEKAKIKDGKDPEQGQSAMLADIEAALVEMEKHPKSDRAFLRAAALMNTAKEENWDVAELDEKFIELMRQNMFSEIEEALTALEEDIFSPEKFEVAGTLIEVAREVYFYDVSQYETRYDAAQQASLFATIESAIDAFEQDPDSEKKYYRVAGLLAKTKEFKPCYDISEFDKRLAALLETRLSQEGQLN